MPTTVTAEESARLQRVYNEMRDKGITEETPSMADLVTQKMLQKLRSKRR